MPDTAKSESSFRAKLIRLLKILHSEFGSLFHITLLFSLVQVVLDLAGIGLLIQVIWIATGSSSHQIIQIPESWSLLFILLLLFGFFLLKNILSLLIYAQSLKNYYSIGLRFAEKKINSLISNGIDYNKQNSSSISQEIYNVSYIFSQNVLTSLFQFITESVAGIGLLIFAWFMTGNLFLILILLLLPASILMFKQLKSVIRSQGKKNHELVVGFYALLNDLVFGFNELKVMHKMRAYKERYLDQIKELHNNKIRLMLMGDAFNFRFIEVTAILVLLMIVWYLELTGMRENFSGVIAVFGIVAFRMLPSLNRITGSLNHLHQQSHIIDSAINIDEANPVEVPEAIHPEIIEIRDLTFSYNNDEYLFENLSFTLRKGSINAISGPSGIGKSTLLNVLCGVLLPKSGEFVLNGDSIGTIPLYQRIRMSLVSQEVYLFEGSIAENICLKKQPDLSDPLLMESLKQAELYTWVQSLPQNLKTPIGEWGKLISGGQKQRMAIARALYHEADLIVMDEATRALDQENEQAILSTMRKLAQNGKIVLMVSHNKDVLNQADQIIYLNR